jgi:hypothetical protein
VNDDDLCTSEYPGDSNFAGHLCNLKDKHEGNHLARGMVGPGWRMVLVWTQDGKILPYVMENTDGANHDLLP